MILSHKIIITDQCRQNDASREDIQCETIIIVSAVHTIYRCQQSWPLWPAPCERADLAEIGNLIMYRAVVSALSGLHLFCFRSSLEHLPPLNEGALS
ncbi:hypothetical protein PoB_000169800 [Plakobranchus ocellatus]|uniref:Uncharacterized protein n=1 Tax=Plakobranchus ocellatus TaxID=259542 RepID=A0AAV3XY78_9GAST|nr:hypothetical protein PoB_000169800 [Plakobranchus ocellatus]